MYCRLRGDFSKYIVDAESGYWVARSFASAVQTDTPIPARAVTNGIYDAEFQAANGLWYPLQPALLKDEWLFQTNQNNTGQSQYPRKFTLEGDNLVLLPTPTQAVNLKIRFYLRPSTLCTSQNSKNGTDRGRITAINPGVSITVNALPFNMQATIPSAITSSELFDVIRVSGWYQPTFYSQSIASIVGTTITPTDASWITAHNVKVGDYVRVAEQTDWPQLADEWHECLAHDAACMVLNEMGYAQKLALLQDKVTAVHGRFRESLVPRSQARPQPLLIRQGMSIGRNGWSL